MTAEYGVELRNRTARITIKGKLDTTSAPGLSEELKKLQGQEIDRVVFFVNELEYISSAGLRVIIFAKQKVGVKADIYFIGAQQAVLDILKMTGLTNFLICQDSYEQ
jgi:anti-anti-sigma factor